MYYSDIKNLDIANGPGMRVSLFVSGCRNHCKNCFNPETWNFTNGLPYTQETEDKIIDMINNSYMTGLTILGGEPMEPENQSEVLKLCKRVKEEFKHSKDIWIYTGFTYEELLDSDKRCCIPEAKEILKLIDVLVDGLFVEELKDISLKFRGSKNQRIIDVYKSMIIKDIQLIEKYK